MQKNTCCFTGHRHLPAAKIPDILRRLDQALDALIALDVTDFISGGALGFDQMAAFHVLEKKISNPTIRLRLALPCKTQDALWNATQKSRYRSLMQLADETIFVSQAYDRHCMERRNRYMVDHAGYLHLRDAMRKERHSPNHRLCIREDQL